MEERYWYCGVWIEETGRSWFYLSPLPEKAMAESEK